MFDPSLFMQQQVDKPLETEYKLVPTGEYEAMIDDFPAEAVQKFDFEYKKGPNAGQPGSMYKFRCPFVLTGPAAEKAKQELNRDKVIVYKEVTLDIDESGGLDFGVNKNVELGRIRAGAKQNVDGPWSISKLRGAGPMMIKVTHRDWERDGKKGTVAEVDRIVPIA